jgi:hypothetical protein
MITRVSRYSTRLHQHLQRLAAALPWPIGGALSVLRKLGGKAVSEFSVT